ncbi:MAG: adenosine deaminase [Bacteroidia bacterium]|nr:adenosine deaminase [Bacteroidia bacterium]
MKFHILALLFLFGNGLLAQDAAYTSEYYGKIKREGDLAKLQFFFSQMPKGGDLHHHFGGSLYAESYLEWLEEKGYYLNTESLKASKENCAPCVSISEVIRNSNLFERVIERWSAQDYEHTFAYQLPPDQHFFNSFSYFGEREYRDYREGLINIKQRALKENVQYIETQALIIRMPFSYSEYDDSLWESQKARDTAALFQLLGEIEQKMQGKELNATVEEYISTLQGYHKGLDQKDFSLRYQAYITRFRNPSDIFTSLYASFLAASKDELIVGINIVAPEHGRVSMRDYWLHMQMFNYISHKFPQVKMSLHAGELALGMVKPEDLSFHIHDALFIAGAHRIGHGIDMPFEVHAVKSLTYMAENQIPVEVNLTSNEFILGISGPEHPLKLYHEFGVPIVISTDDAGVSRNNLSSEYTKLGSRYDFSYRDIKGFVYNSIRYSFMSTEDKERSLKLLDEKFEAFEAMIASHYKNLGKK